MSAKILILVTAPFEIDLIKNELEKSADRYVERFIDGTVDWLKEYDRFEPNIFMVGYELLQTVSNDFLNPQIRSNTPLICFGGNIGEENVIELLKSGISDIVFKTNLSALVPKIQRALGHSETVIPTSVKLPRSDLRLTTMEAMGSNTIFENCMEGILLTLPDGGIVAANPAACDMFGMTEQELIAKGRLGLVDITDPNLEILLEERRTKGKAKGEIRLIRGDGTIFQAILSSVLFNDASGSVKTALIVRDISASREFERQLLRTKDELQETFMQLNKTFQSSQDIICALDKQGRFVSVSPASEAVWGYRPEDLIGQVCFDYIVPEDLEKSVRAEQSTRQGSPVSMLENRYIHKSGRIVHMLWSGIWDKTEQRMYATAKDITENRRLQKICEIESKRFLDLYDQAPCCLGILKGPEHIFEMANPLYLQLINKDVDIIGKRVVDVLPEIKNQGFIELLDGVYKTGKSFVAKEMLVKFDTVSKDQGSERYLDFMYMAHRNEEDHIAGILFFAIDVTEQVASRLKIEDSAKLYRNLIRELPVAAYSCDASGKIIIYNKAAATLWGREPEIGTDMWCGAWKMLSAKGKNIPPKKSPMGVALIEGRTVSGTEIIIERESGERRSILPHVVPYFNSSNEITGAVALLTDVTDAKKAETNLRQQNEELLKANLELDRFVYSVSHDLRAPLTSINGLATFIEEESNEPETVKQIKMIRESISRLDGFIRKILSYSQNNRSGIEIEPIVIKEKIVGIIDSLKNMSVDKNIHFDISIDEAHPFASDWQRINAILENLISNAIKYQNPDASHKYIKVQGRVGKKTFNFSVSDNGIGIAPEFHHKIFDMFFRVSGNSEGSGIGLYIVKDMVERLGGSIKVNSQKGGVTTFDVALKNFTVCLN